MKLRSLKGVLAGCLAVLAGCSDGPTEVEGEVMDLERARGLWDARGRDDYGMTVRLTGAWIGGAAAIRVRDGVPVSVRPLEPNQGLPPGVFRDYDTVEELFAMLQRAENEADRVVVEYHSRLGVPVQAGIDWHANAIDDETGFIVESFELR